MSDPSMTIAAALNYDPFNGQLIWRVSRGNRLRKGTVAGSKKASGYIYIGFGGKQHLAHRIAWFLSYGEWPTQQIDHIDGNRSNNRLTNLRLATFSQQRMNQRLRRDNQTGFKGVQLDKPSGLYRAKIRKDGQIYYIGHFKTAEEAHAAYVKASQERFGEFARAK